MDKTKVLTDNLIMAIVDQGHSGIKPDPDLHSALLASAESAGINPEAFAKGFELAQFMIFAGDYFAV